jgi:hypothetical protein
MKSWPAALLAAMLPLAPGAAEQAPAPSPPAAPAPTQPEQPEQPAPPPPAWLPRGAAKLVLLDKVTAQPRDVTVPVGQSVTFGSLTIAVRACDVRPPDVPEDATALLDITDSHPGMPNFHGWMLVSAPAASMLEHPVYDVRLLGCGK